MGQTGSSPVAELESQLLRVQSRECLVGRSAVEGGGGLSHERSLEHDPREVGVGQVLVGEGAHAGAAVPLDLDDAGGLEVPDGLADRHHRHAEVVGQLL